MSNQRVSNQRLSNSNSSKQSRSNKKHYFIGAKLDNNISNNLEKIKQSVPQHLIHHEQRTFHTRFVYLGYLSDEHAEQFVQFLNPAFIALAKRFKSLKGNFGNYNSQQKSGYKKISINYESDIISNIVVPYLRSYVNKILHYENNNNYSPHVNLFTAKDKFDASRMHNNMIPNHFNINSIDILAGTPVNRRSGTPSKNDTMNMEIYRSIPFVGNLSNQNK